MEEEWRPLVGYWSYDISDQGRVKNTRTGHILTPTRQGDSRPCVALVQKGIQVRRGLALLVCSTFWEPPRKDFDTPIHLDGDPINCWAVNLAWRPRWFALAHTQQFSRDLGDTGAIRNITTGEFYANVWEAVFAEGLLYNDVVKSIVNKTYVFPTMHVFEWVDPD